MSSLHAEIWALFGIFIKRHKVLNLLVTVEPFHNSQGYARPDVVIVWMKNCSQATYLFRSMSEEEEEDADEAGALGLPLLLPPPPLLLLWHSGVERGSPASQLSADEREPDRSSDDLQGRRSVRRLGT